jgi:hypothetical protein
MTTITQEPEAPEVAALGDDTRREIIELRNGGMTLKDLRDRFPQLSSEQIRDVLPPANQRERKARETKAKAQADSEVPETTFDKFVPEERPEPERTPRSRKAGNPGEESTQTATVPSSRTPSNPEQHAAEARPEEPRYATDLGDLPERVLAARDVVGGRGKLAELLGGISGSAVWRHERGRTHPTEVAALREALAQVEAKIAAGEFVKAAAEPKATGPSKADLTHRIEVAAELCRSGRGDKAITKGKLADALLAVLDPQA